MRKIGVFIMDKPIYVAKKSAFAALKPWCVLSVLAFIALGVLLGYVIKIPFAHYVFFAFAVVVALIQLCFVIHIKTFRLKVYQDRIVVKSGLIFVKQETHGLFVGVVRMNIYQNFWGNLLDYGTLTLECVGRTDMCEAGIFDPHALKFYLQNRFINAANAQTLLVNQ